jgi:hypothetical protein
MTVYKQLLRCYHILQVFGDLIICTGLLETQKEHFDCIKIVVVALTIQSICDRLDMIPISVPYRKLHQFLQRELVYLFIFAQLLANSDPAVSFKGRMICLAVEHLLCRLIGH